jgi:hypothetical protein
MASRVRRPEWRPHTATVPLGQGDLVLVAWAKTIDPTESHGSSSLHPTVGARDGLHLRFWDDGPPNSQPPQVLEMWGCYNYSLAVVISEGCAIDKEFNILRRQFEAEGASATEAMSKAAASAAGFVSIAEVWPVAALPEHVQREAESGAVGYVPLLIPEWWGDDRPYAVDLSRIATVSWRALDQRIAMATVDPGWQLRLQSGLCRYFASRTIRITEDLQTVFQQAVLRVEAVDLPVGNPPRVRVRVHFAGGRSQVLEAIQESPAAEPIKTDAGPGLETRR